VSAPTLAVVTAGLSQPSSTRLLADRLTSATQRELRARGLASADVHVIDLRDLAHDITDQLLTGFGRPALRTAIEQVTTADGLIAVTPLYSGSYSGLFKSFFDILDNDLLAGKPVLIAATGGTARHSLALEHALRPMFAYLRAMVVPTAVYAAAEDWGGAGDAHTASLAARITRAGDELAVQMSGRHVTAPAETVTPFEQQLAALKALPSKRA
jgi:FMN reductase